MLRISLCLVNLALLTTLIVVPVAAQEPTPTPEFSSSPIVTPAPMLTPVSLTVCAGTVAQSCLYVPFYAR